MKRKSMKEMKVGDKVRITYKEETLNGEHKYFAGRIVTIESVRPFKIKEFSEKWIPKDRIIEVYEPFHLPEYLFELE